jgi:hypothetical protein
MSEKRGRSKSLKDFSSRSELRCETGLLPDLMIVDVGEIEAQNYLKDN